MDGVLDVRECDNQYRYYVFTFSWHYVPTPQLETYSSTLVGQKTTFIDIIG